MVYPIFITHNHTGKQINNCANIISVFAILEIGHITNPYLVRLTHIKFLIEMIFILASFVLIQFFAV